MSSAAALEKKIREVVDIETEALDNQDIDKLMSLFHVDMVWPWPGSSNSHDPILLKLCPKVVV
jgi:hypothetical protein